MTTEDLKLKVYTAQKNNDANLVGVLRYLLSAVQNKEIELRTQGKTVDSDVLLSIIKKQIKDRKKAIELYEKGNRKDLVDKESYEIQVLEGLINEFEES